MKDEQRTICVSAEDKCGVLMRVIGIIVAKGANIDRIAAYADPGCPGRSKILIVATLEPRLQRRVLGEINRLINVFWALDVTGWKRRDAAVRRWCGDAFVRIERELAAR